MVVQLSLLQLEPRESFNKQLDSWKDQIGITTSSMNLPVEQKVVRKLQIAATGKENELGHEFWLSSLWKTVHNRGTKVSKQVFCTLFKAECKKS